MNRFLLPTAIALAAASSMASSAAHASLVDLTTFSAISGEDGSSSVSSTLASISGVAALSGRVENLVSFDWKFSDSSNGDGFTSFLTTPVGGVSSLTNLANTSTGSFQTFTFAAPFSGVIKFSVDSHDVSTQATLSIQNVVVSAVPEPSTLALLLSGMGLVGFVGLRRATAGSAGRGRQTFAAAFT